MSLKHAAKKGVLLTALGTVSQMAIRMSWILVFARGLGPDAFGAVAFALGIIEMLRLINDTGVSEAVIQKQSLTTIESSSLYWTNQGMAGAEP